MKRLYVGGRQGRGDPLLSHHDQGEGPGLLSSRAFWVGGAVCVAFWLWVLA